MRRELDEKVYFVYFDGNNSYLTWCHLGYILFVSHRMSSCKMSNRIIVFKDGQIIQQGKHAQLVNEDGEYKKLWSAQAQYY